MHWVNCLETILSVLSLIFLDETPHNLLSRGENEEAWRVLNKMARMNNSHLSEDINLVVRKRDEKQIDSNQHWDIFWGTIKNRAFLKSWLLLLSIAAVGKMVTDGFSFILTDLLYLNGETEGDYCSGSQSRTYYLTKQDYIKLLLSQFTTFLSIIIAYPVLKFGVPFKIQGLFIFAIDAGLILMLYLCPDAILALSILSLVRINIRVIQTTSRLEQIQLKMPAEIHATIFGIGGAINSVPVPFYPLLTQSLSKISNHYVTSITLLVTIIGLVAFILLPIDVNKEIREKEECELQELKERYDVN